MAHLHQHEHSSHRQASKNISLAFFLNFGFAVIELVGGIMTNSVAILSDAVHDFGDSISLGISWYLQRLSRRGRDRHYSYGYRRFSLLGSLFISVVLIVSSVFIVREAVERILEPATPKAQGMLILAILGLLVNGLVALKLNSRGSLNERAIFLHVMEDVLGWMAVLIASIVLMFVDFPIIDPLLSIAICMWVLSNVYKNIKATLKVLLQEVPKDVEVDNMVAAIQQLPEVHGTHDLHLWTLDGEEHIMTIHVITDDAITVEEQKQLKINVRQICEQFNVGHATIELETQSEHCRLIGC